MRRTSCVVALVAAMTVVAVGAGSVGSAGAVTVGAGTAAEQVADEDLRAEAEVADTDGAASVPELDLGVTMLALWSDWAVIDEMFDRVARAEVRTMRIDTGWCSLEEAGRGIVSSWYQSRLDQVVDRARALDIELLLMVGCTPAWAGGRTYHDLPANPAEYQRVMTYLSRRYAGRVAAWEIWNEPDCIGGCGRGSAEVYVPVLKAGFRGVRAGDPTALVVSAGISGNNLKWLTRMYAAGARGYFDVLATHPYLTPTTAAPNQLGDGTYSISSVEAVHDLMVRNGDGAKPVWFTEYGWSTPGPGADRPGVTESKQAGYLTRSIDVIQRYPYVTRAYWFMLRDRADSTPYENAFGLIERDGSPKASYTAFRKAVATLKP